MPWTWSPGRNCWRSIPMATWAMAMASPALIPSNGAAEAWALLPVKVTSKWETARQVPCSRSVGQGWIIMAAWTSSKTPSSSMVILPPPPSSAGVPSTRTVRPSSSATPASPMPAPTAEAAMMLWPQAWPTPGRASYSAHTASTIGPEPISAVKAVGMPEVPAGHREPSGLESVRRPCAGPLLLERRLRMGVDGVAEADQRGQVGVDWRRGPCPSMH